MNGQSSCVHIYNGLLLSHKKECISVSSHEVDGPRAYYTEWVIKRKTNIVYQHIQHIYMESRRMVQMNLFAEQQWRCRHREQTYGQGRVEEEGEGEKNGESSMEAYILTNEVDSQWEFAVWLREPKLGLCNNLEQWEWAGGGRKLQEGGDICTPVVNSCWCMTEINQYCKATNQLK